MDMSAIAKVLDTTGSSALKMWMNVPKAFALMATAAILLARTIAAAKRVCSTSSGLPA
ncbi:unnamed protein product [Gongylonema pulchrum]|uniref:Transglycosylase n=1 Tax=Gongylonema pulchrum TaxID=637853 RepID=A0A183DLQ6_9BILA|nr:unnamed protein product [Gongylonema pulchrum]